MRPTITVITVIYPAINRLILPPDGQKITHGRHAANTQESHQDTIPPVIERRVLALKRKGRHDAADVAEPNLPRRPDTPPDVTGQVHGEPANDDRHGRVRAHGHEKKGGVLGVVVPVDAQEDGDAGDGDGDGADDEEEAVAELVRGICDEEREDEGGGHGRDGVQLGLDRAVAVTLDDGGGEVRKSYRHSTGVGN